MKEKHFRCRVAIDVQWGDMDALGHVNNVMYFRYFETARIKYLEEIGLGDFEEREEVPVVAHLSMNFRRQVTYPARLDAQARVSEFRNRSFVMECRMFVVGSDELAADGTAVVVWVNKRTGKAVPLPDDVRRAAERYESEALA